MEFLLLPTVAGLTEKSTSVCCLLPMPYKVSISDTAHAAVSHHFLWNFSLASPSFDLDGAFYTSAL